MTEQPQPQPQSPQPLKIPPPPKPRTDLPPPKGESPEDYQQYLEMLSYGPVDSWRDQDGTIYLFRMPASMATPGALVDSPTAIAPDDPSYAEWESDLQPEFDFMLPTKVAPEPRQSPQGGADGKQSAPTAAPA